MSEEYEVHIKTYDEWLKYYKNATKEQVIEDLTRDVQYFADAIKDIKNLQQKVEQLEKENEKLKQENKRIFQNVNDDELLISNAMNYAEVQRLNNIINELEKELNKKKEAIKTIKDMLGEETKNVNPHIEVLETEYKYFLDKLKELKEVK